MSKGKTGASSVTHKTPARMKRDAKRRRAQEKRWAKRSGPVVIIRPADKQIE